MKNQIVWALWRKKWWPAKIIHVNRNNKRVKVIFYGRNKLMSNEFSLALNQVEPFSGNIETHTKDKV